MEEKGYLSPVAQLILVFGMIYLTTKVLTGIGMGIDRVIDHRMMRKTLRQIQSLDEVQQ